MEMMMAFNSLVPAILDRRLAGANLAF